MMSLTGIRGFSDPTGSWKMICIRRRSFLSALPFLSKIVLAVEGEPRPPSAAGAG